jgi:metal-responsive CopG/Arc/MetJ family transcriptional regulator
MRDHDAVERTTLSIPGPLLERLRVAAAERRVSMAEFVREALEEKLASRRPVPRCLGVGASGYRDTAREASDERPEPRAWR